MIRLICALALGISAPAIAQPVRSADIPGCSAEAARQRLPLPHGCATALNLEAMVADAADLARGREFGPAIGEPVVTPVRRHRLGQVPEPRDRSTTTPEP
jgi:type IV pilus biogenesis protein CpaD/CtpE